jgi:hypothetical protein
MAIEDVIRQLQDQIGKGPQGQAWDLVRSLSVLITGTGPVGPTGPASPGT